MTLRFPPTGSGLCGRAKHKSQARLITSISRMAKVFLQRVHGGAKDFLNDLSGRIILGNLGIKTGRSQPAVIDRPLPEFAKPTFTTIASDTPDVRHLAQGCDLGDDVLARKAATSPSSGVRLGRRRICAPTRHAPKHNRDQLNLAGQHGKAVHLNITILSRPECHLRHPYRRASLRPGLGRPSDRLTGLARRFCQRGGSV